MQQDVEINSPLAPYMLTTSEHATLDHAEGRLIAACAKEFGYDYPTMPYSQLLERRILMDEESQSRFYGVSDKQAAQRLGYGLDPVPGDGAREAEERLSSQPGAAEVLAGSEDGSPLKVGSLEVPPGGCIGQARRELGLQETLDEGKSIDVARQILARSTGQFASVQPAVEAMRDWSNCMKDKGYNAKSVFDDEEVGQLLNARPDPDTATPDEVTRAIADVDCKQQTDLVKRLDAVRIPFEQKLVEDNILLLQEARKRLDGIVVKSTAALEQLGETK